MFFDLEDYFKKVEKKLHSPNDLSSRVFVKQNKKIGLISFIVAAIIAFSRIYFGFHYVSDVLAGALYGIMGGLITYFAYTKIFEYVVRKRNEKKGER